MLCLYSARVSTSMIHQQDQGFKVYTNVRPGETRSSTKSRCIFFLSSETLKISFFQLKVSIPVCAVEELQGKSRGPHPGTENS